MSSPTIERPATCRRMSPLRIRSLCCFPQLFGIAAKVCASPRRSNVPPTAQMPPLRYGGPAAAAAAPWTGPTKSSIVKVVEGPRQECTSSLKTPPAMVKKWNIRLRPSWPEPLPRPESRRSRAVSIADAPRITTSASTRRCRPLSSMNDTPVTRARLDVVVEGRQLVVGERPVSDVGVGHGPVEREALEVLAPEARRLRVPMHGAAAHHRGQRVHVAHERARHALLRLRLAARRARLQDDVLVLEEAAGLHLVVAEERADRARRAEAGQQVPPLLEDQHAVPGGRERPGGDAAPCARAHDDGRPAHQLLGMPLRPSQNCVRDAPWPLSAGRKRCRSSSSAPVIDPVSGPAALTSASVEPRGCRSPGQRV